MPPKLPTDPWGDVPDLVDAYNSDNEPDVPEVSQFDKIDWDVQILGFVDGLTNVFYPIEVCLACSVCWFLILNACSQDLAFFELALMAEQLLLEEGAPTLLSCCFDHVPIF